MASSSLWQRFQQYFLHYRALGFSIDISRMKFPEDFVEKMQPKIDKAFVAMRELEAAAIANPDEKRMVGHYWLRSPALTPSAELRADIEETKKCIKRFAEDVHAGKIAAENGKHFEHILLIGIGGSALGPRFVADALGPPRDAMDIYFFDNTDPDGFDRIFDKIDNYLSQTLVVVVSKSGGTKETRNGILEAESLYWEGIKLDEKVYGPEHPNTLNDRMNLATALQADGKYSDADVEYREVIKLEGKGEICRSQSRVPSDYQY